MYLYFLYQLSSSATPALHSKAKVCDKPTRTGKKDPAATATGSFTLPFMSKVPYFLIQENMERIFSPVVSMEWVLMASRCSRSHL